MVVCHLQIRIISFYFCSSGSSYSKVQSLGRYILFFPLLISLFKRLIRSSLIVESIASSSVVFLSSVRTAFKCSIVSPINFHSNLRNLNYITLILTIPHHYPCLHASEFHSFAKQKGLVLLCVGSPTASPTFDDH